MSKNTPMVKRWWCRGLSGGGSHAWHSQLLEPRSSNAIGYLHLLGLVVHDHVLFLKMQDCMDHGGGDVPLTFHDGRTQRISARLHTIRVKS